MATSRPWREIRRSRGPDAEARVAQIKQAMDDVLALAELREHRELTQSDVAERLGTRQPAVSRLERREDLYLSSLREYIEALGGTLELAAIFPDGERVQITPAKASLAVG